MDQGTYDSSIAVPARAPGFPRSLLFGRRLPALAARIGIALARRSGKPFRLGKRVIAARHADVDETLRRDLDFGIEAVNGGPIGEVNHGRFILGMDRSAPLELERRALYAALAAVDLERLREETRADAASVLAAVPAGGTIDAVGGYARPVAARTAMRLFGLAAVDERMVMEVARTVFGHCFMGLGKDPAAHARAMRAGDYMAGWFRDEIDRRTAAGDPGDDLMGQLLRQGLLDKEGVRRTLGGMFVGSVDTTASCVAKVIAVAASDRGLADALRRDADDLPRLYGWCNEALRRWPHNPFVLRKALTDTAIAGCPVTKGDTVIAWTQAAMLDATVFESPERLRPDRDSAAYLHLGGGLHPCSGRPVNRFQIPLLVGGLAARGLGRVGRIGWAAGFPHRLDVQLTEGPR